jgi:N-acetylglutamate synthase-like GNAT family acetyltransferase
MQPVIRQCTDKDLGTMYSIVNDAAEAYHGAIPADCWKAPYMPEDEIRSEIAAGVKFWGASENGELLGIMGLQHVQDVALIRHAYVRTSAQRGGIGGKLLAFLCEQTTRPILIGTWNAAVWAIRFYEKHGFMLVTKEEKDRLLRKYWSISDRQVETSVVLTLCLKQRARSARST